MIFLGGYGLLVVTLQVITGTPFCSITRFKRYGSQKKQESAAARAQAEDC
jgi:hypothetical protein